MATNEMQRFGKKIYLIEDNCRNTYVNVCQNVCSEIEIKAYFRFSHYKSIENLSCHSDEST